MAKNINAKKKWHPKRYEVKRKVKISKFIKNSDKSMKTKLNEIDLETKKPFVRFTNKKHKK
ncbi:hypothetical protein NUSPORA_01008 [Nucleospora cyclopteri]